MMRALHLFAGAGGSVLAGRLLGWESVGAVELDPYCCAVLEARGERVLARDITAFDARPLRGQVDVVVGGWPCQDLSVAGKRAGLAGGRSGLFWQMMRVVDECEPRFVFGENVAGLLSSNGGRDFGTVLHALAERGFDARWQVLGARDVGAPHRRNRVWIVAESRRQRDAGRGGAGDVSGAAGAVEGEGDQRERVRDAAGNGGATGGGLEHARGGELSQRDGVAGWGAVAAGLAGSGGGMAVPPGPGPQERHGVEPRGEQQRGAHAATAPHHRGDAQPRVGREPDGLAHGMDWPAARGAWPAGRGAAQHAWEAPRTVTEKVPDRVARLKALGNGWVPQCAAAAWRLLTHDLVVTERCQARAPGLCLGFECHPEAEVE